MEEDRIHCKPRRTHFEMSYLMHEVADFLQAPTLQSARNGPVKEQQLHETKLRQPLKVDLGRK